MAELDGGVGRRTPEKSTLYCSFCGKSQHEAVKMIAGPTVFICDECVLLCLEHIDVPDPRLLCVLVSQDATGISEEIWERVSLTGPELFKEVFGSVPGGLQIPESSRELLKIFGAAIAPHLVRAQSAQDLEDEEEQARAALEQFDAKQADQRQRLVEERQALVEAFQHAQAKSRTHAERG